MSEFKQYKRKGLSEMRPYIEGESLFGVSVGKTDTPEKGGMIARNPKDHDDQWYVAKAYFQDNLELAGSKTLDNSTAKQAKDQVVDLQLFGNGDLFRLLSKASSKREGWMKSTKAMEIENVGCVVQVTTQQGDQVAEAISFVPGVKILRNNEDPRSGRHLVRI